MGSSIVTINLNTLTPIWTGGVEGKVDRLHATSVIGSLRWAYEILVRGVGGNACDPSQHSCIYDKNQPNYNLCDVCQIFGATGYSRRFRLLVTNENHLHPATLLPRNIAVNARRYTTAYGKSKIPTWYFNSD